MEDPSEDPAATEFVRVETTLIPVPHRYALPAIPAALTLNLQHDRMLSDSSRGTVIACGIILFS